MAKPRLFTSLLLTLAITGACGNTAEEVAAAENRAALLTRELSSHGVQFAEGYVITHEDTKGWNRVLEFEHFGSLLCHVSDPLMGTTAVDTARPPELWCAPYELVTRTEPDAVIVLRTVEEEEPTAEFRLIQEIARETLPH